MILKKSHNQDNVDHFFYQQRVVRKKLVKEGCIVFFFLIIIAHNPLSRSQESKARESMV